MSYMKLAGVGIVIFSMCHAETNIELYNTTDFPVYYALSGPNVNPFTKPIKSVNPKNIAVEEIKPLEDIYYLMVVPKKPENGDRVKVYFLKKARGSFDTIYLDIVEMQSELRVIPQTGPFSKGKLPIKNNIMQKNITMKYFPYVQYVKSEGSVTSQSAKPEIDTDKQIVAILQSEVGKDYIKSLVKTNLENIRRMARKADFSSSDLKPLVATESQNFVRAFTTKGISLNDIPQVEKYIMQLFDQAVNMMQKTDQLLQCPEIRENIGQEVVAAAPMFASLQKMNDEQRQAELMKKAESIAQNLITDPAEKMYVSQMVPEIYRSLRNQYATRETIEEVKEEVKIDPVDVESAESWIMQKLPSIIESIQKNPARDKTLAAREAARKLATEYIQQVMGNTPAELEAKFFAAIIEEVKDVEVVEIQTAEQKAEEKVERVAEGSFLEQIQKATLKHVESEARELISEAEKERLRNLTEEDLEEELDKLRRTILKIKLDIDLKRRTQKESNEVRNLEKQFEKENARIKFMESLLQDIVPDDEDSNEWD